MANGNIATVALSEARSEVACPPWACRLHAAVEWVRLAGDRLRELETAALVLRKRLGRHALEHGEKLPRGLGSERLRVAADEDLAGIHLIRIRPTHSACRGAGMTRQITDGLGRIAADAFGDIARYVELVGQEVFAREKEGRSFFDKDGAQGFVIGLRQRVLFLHRVQSLDGASLQLFERQVEFLRRRDTRGFERLPPFIGPERVDLGRVKSVVEVSDVAAASGRSIVEKRPAVWITARRCR